MTEAEIADARVRAEIAVEKVLLDLEAETGRKIDEVTVDGRNFARCDVEIFWRENTSTTGGASIR